MSWLTNNLTQEVTYWAQTTTLDTFGKRTYLAPVVLLGRWEDKSELITTRSGKEIVSRSNVFLGQDVKNEDYLFEGVSTEADPTDVVDAFAVKDFRRIPNVAGTEFERRAFL